LLLDGFSAAPFLTAHLAFRPPVLCRKLRTVEDFPSWSVNVFDVASDDFDLGIGWRSQAHGSDNQESEFLRHDPGSRQG
jgi:hypothetical protein